jgi:hypothetical protein
MNSISALRGLIIRIFFGCLLAFLSYWALDIWNKSRLAILPDYDYYNDVVALKQEGKVGESLAMCHYVESQPGMPNQTKISDFGKQIELEQASWFGKCNRFSAGFFSGSMNSPEATVGAVVSDFLVVGDIRDLGQQSFNEATGKEVDPMIVVLSSVGVLASISAWVPEPGEPAVVTADGGITLLKGLKKIHALTDDFIGQTVELAKDAAKAEKMGPFGELLENLGLLAKNAPDGTLGTAMKNVESLDDLKSIARSVEAAPNETITILSLGSENGAALLKTSDAVTPRILGKILRKGLAGLASARPYIRGVKFLHEGHLGDIKAALIDWFMDHASARIVLFWLSICGIAISAFVCFSVVVEFRHIFGSSNSAK